jgi:amino acid transporter
LPRRFLAAVHAKKRIPRNNVLLIGAICLGGCTGLQRDAIAWSLLTKGGSRRNKYDWQSRLPDNRL